MTELITMHTHSTFCNHAKDPFEAMVAAALDAGVSAMAATEHYPISDTLDPSGRSSMPPERMQDYIDAVHEQQQAHPELELLYGWELDWLDEADDRGLRPSDFDDCDILLGSVHFVDGWLVNSRRARMRWETIDVDAVWLRYIDLWCHAALSDFPFTIMAHPDVIKRFAYYPSFDLELHYERMARAAKAGGRMVEVNTSGGYTECAEFYPAPKLLRAFHDEGVACTVGTDAHAAAHIVRGVTDAYDYMRQAGYTELAVPQRGGGVVMVPLDEVQ